MGFDPRDYQVEALENSVQLYNGGVNRQLLVLATGLGKTITFATLPAYYRELSAKGVLILVHREELVFQAAEKFKLVNPGLTIDIEKAEMRADLASNVIVASVQTLGAPSGKRLKAMLSVVDFGIVIVDEAHHITAGSQYDRVLNELGLGSLRGESDQISEGNQRLLLGVTATPNRNDKVGLSMFFDDIILDYGIQQAIENGYLTDFEHYRVKTSTSLDGISTRMGDFSSTELADATNTPERNAAIISAYQDICPGRSAVAFCSSVQHAHDLAELFNQAGVSAAAIDGTTPKEERRRILSLHESGDILIVTNFGVLTEGYDGRVHAVIMARPTKSQPLYVQMVGRGVRTMPPDLGNLKTKEERLAAIAASDKATCVVLDLLDSRHDVVTTPSLFGLPVNYDSRGDNLVGVTVKRFGEAMAENPVNADRIMQAECAKDVEYEIERIDIWSIAEGAKDLKGVSEFKWNRIGADSYQIHVMSDDQAFYVQVHGDWLGHYKMQVVHPPKHIGGGKYSPELVQEGPEYPSLESAVQSAENRIHEAYRGAVRLLDKRASWRYGNVTHGQEKMLRSYGVDPSEVKNKGMAADIITAAKAIKMKQDTSVFRRTANV